MPYLTRFFYLFVALHSFLIGLLPVFIPVILWNKGLMLADIAFFIALAALGFIIALYLWDRLRAGHQWSKIVALSFLFEVLLVSILLLDSSAILLSFGALFSGAAGCFYWSTQRILFQHITQIENTGNNFGNFQILVLIALKLGILCGSYLLAGQQTALLILLFFSVSILGYWILQHQLTFEFTNLNSHQPKAFSLAKILNFRDNFRSRGIFLIDGVFLFLESYFWVLSIYLLTQQNLLKLGLLIVLLSLLLGAIFYVIKKHIDRVNGQRIFMFAVFGYAFSWFLRGELNTQAGPIFLYANLLLIAFLSSFFRLAFNKRFYDIARLTQPIQYIVCKSYYSQFALILFFTLTGYLLNSDIELQQQFNQLQYLYLFVIPLVFVYLRYADVNKNKAPAI